MPAPDDNADLDAARETLATPTPADGLAGVDAGRVADKPARAARIALGVASLLLVAAVSVCVHVFRDAIMQYASLGYVATGLVCFVLNCGVFGISPSALVALQMAQVLDPALVALAAGVGAGLGEVTSYAAGRATDLVADSRYDGRIKRLSAPSLAGISFVGSFVSGNVSDAIGLACGRLGKPLSAFLLGAGLAKVAKMFVAVYAGDEMLDFAGSLLQGVTQRG